MKEILDKHEKIVLQFSGGKDSVACLLLLQPWWERINVIWVNTGDVFPETEAIVRQFQKVLPHFQEVHSDAPGWIKQFGHPSDIVPIWASEIGLSLGGQSQIKIASAFDCTAANLWLPLEKATKDYGATLVIRGQRADEQYKTPVVSGHMEDGIEYLFPIQGWSKFQVLTYLKAKDFPIPEHFEFEESSLDCVHCTAFCGVHEDRKEWMKKNHPQEFTQVQVNISKIVAEVMKEIPALARQFSPSGEV